MRRQLMQRIAQALMEEEAHEPDMVLLDRLRILSAEETVYFDLPPEQRRALNVWFSEVRDLLLQELLAGNFGSQILVDTFFILAFEVGYKLGIEAKEKKEGEL